MHQKMSRIYSEVYDKFQWWTKGSQSSYNQVYTILEWDYRYSPTQHVNAVWDYTFCMYPDVFCAQGCATVCVCTHILVLNHVDKLATILANYIPTDIQHFSTAKKCINIIVSIQIWVQCYKDSFKNTDCLQCFFPEAECNVESHIYMDTKFRQRYFTF